MTKNPTTRALRSSVVTPVPRLFFLPPTPYTRRTDGQGPEFGVRSKGAAVESSLPLQNLGVSENGVEDMTRLDYLHEPAILFNLRRRFFRALPYTYTGEIVIACNPYQ